MIYINITGIYSINFTHNGTKPGSRYWNNLLDFNYWIYYVNNMACKSKIFDEQTKICFLHPLNKDLCHPRSRESIVIKYLIMIIVLRNY